MEERDLLAHTVAALERLNIPYFVTGSVASGLWGEPRLTNDIDIVAHIGRDSLGIFCEAFPSPEFYVSDAAARAAVERGGQFNIIHPDTGLKIDIIVVPPSAYDTSRINRRVRVSDAAVQGYFASPEDVILSKMLFYKEGQSEKHLRDITGVLRLCRSPIDYQYIQEWAQELDVVDIWQAILNRVRSDS